MMIITIISTATMNIIIRNYGGVVSTEREHKKKTNKKRKLKQENGEHKDTNRESLLHPRGNVELDVERVINTRRSGRRAEGGEELEIQKVASKRTKLTSYLTTRSCHQQKIRQKTSGVFFLWNGNKFSSQMCYTFIVRVSLL